MSETLAQAFVRAQAEMHHAKLDAKNTHFKSSYATLQSVIDAVKPALNRNGLAFLQRAEPVDGGVMVETVFLHVSGDQMSAGKVHVPTSKFDAHGTGSAYTYAKRYGLAMACGIGSDEDDDGNQAAANPPQRRSTSVAAAVIETGGARFDPQIRDDICEAIDNCFADDPESGLALLDPDALDLILDRLRKDAELKIGVWAALPSKVRTFIKRREAA
jgi:hypothetical protein